MLLKSSQRLVYLPTIYRRCSTYQVKKLNQICSVYATKSHLSSNFTRSYSVEIEKPVMNEHWLGSKPGSGLIHGRAATSLQDTFIRSFVMNNEEASTDDWIELSRKVFEVKEGSINEINFDGRVLDCCITLNNLNLGRSYLKYLRDIGRKYNSSTVCNFIKLCYENRRLCTDEDLAKVEQFTRYLLVRYKVFDSIVGESIVKGLCLKNDWQKCAEIVDQMREYITVNNEIISSFATCLLENDEIQKAWSVLTNSTDKKLTLRNDVFIAWIEKTRSNPDQIQQLLKFLQFSNVIPRKTVCDQLITAFSQYPPEKQLTGTYVSIESSGKCPNCGEKLQKVDITDEEFNMLRDEFLNRVLIRDDIFKNTTPKELKNFFEIVKRNAPFDIVIDGLNVIYMSGTMKSERVYSRLLTETVRHFVERDQKVLVIGRKHMYNYAKENLEYVRENSTLFLISDVSEDDPYMIYATFYSGPESCFVTRDLMRSEKYKLSSDKLALLFKRWQQSHQIFIEYVNYSSGRVFFKTPILFEMAAQPSKFGWHVPYHPDTYSGTDDYGLHERWLCLKNDG